MKDTQPKVKLIIVGDGPYRKTLETLVKDLGLQNYIQFKGYVKAEEKTKLIASSAALVFPSLCEGFGLVILESFAQEKPVLVSNVRPLSDIVTYDVSGFVLDPHDEKIWADHILKIINNSQHAKMMGKNGNILLTVKYNQDIMYRKIINMYKAITNVM